MEYNNENKGVLFKNKKKASDKHPDYNGSINIDGTDYWLSAWINEDKNGNKYMALARGDKKEVQAGTSTEQAGYGGDEEDDDSLPLRLQTGDKSYGFWKT